MNIIFHAFFSPFKRPNFKFYFGNIEMGTPYFYPRKMIDSKTKKGYYEFKDKKWFGIDFVGLGWKTKWSDTDYRFEYAPMFSLVFLKKQFCIFLHVDEPNSYWESMLYYYHNTLQNHRWKDRVDKLKHDFPQTWTSHTSDGKVTRINYYTTILKEKYADKI